MTELDFQVSLLKEAKFKEQLERESRIKIEEVVAALIPGPERGSKTVTLEDGTKITVERGWNYAADCGEIGHQCNLNGVTNVPVRSKTTYQLDEAGYEWYKANDKKVFDLISPFVIVTPKKTAVRIQNKK
jgi:hypothetical protein